MRYHLHTREIKSQVNDVLTYIHTYIPVHTCKHSCKVKYKNKMSFSLVLQFIGLCLFKTSSIKSLQTTNFDIDLKIFDIISRAEYSQDWGLMRLYCCTFPVDFTPFQMQKKQMTHMARRHNARSHLIEPMSPMPFEILSTFRLEGNTRRFVSGCKKRTVQITETYFCNCYAVWETSRKTSSCDCAGNSKIF